MGLPRALQSRTYHFLFLDVVGFSAPNNSAKEQAKIVSFLNQILKSSVVVRNTDKKRLIMRSTGDGFVIGFADSKEKPCRLAIEIQRKIHAANKKADRGFAVRIGLHSGDIYPTKDINGNDDVCGPGIILAQRVMDFGDGNHILASDKIAADLSKLSDEYQKMIHPLNKYVAKHGEEIFIYNIYSQGFGNPASPSAKTIGSVATIYEILETKAQVKVVMPNKFLTRVRVTRKIKNVGMAPIHSIHYTLILHSPSTWKALHVKAYDNEGKALESPQVIQDKPTYKECLIHLRDPLLPGKLTTLTHEFEWVEPRRRIDLDFMYAQQSKRLLTIDFISQQSPIFKPRVYEIHSGTGKRKILSTDSMTRKIQRGKKSQIGFHWTSRNLKLGHLYSLYW